MSLSALVGLRTLWRSSTCGSRRRKSVGHIRSGRHTRVQVGRQHLFIRAGGLCPHRALARHEDWEASREGGYFISRQKPSYLPVRPDCIWGIGDFCLRRRHGLGSGISLVPRTRRSHIQSGKVDCELRVQKGHRHHMFAIVPVIPKLAPWRAAMYGELRNRHTVCPG